VAGEPGDAGHFRDAHSPQHAGERSGLIAVVVLTAQTMIFFIFYQQTSTSLTLFAYRNVDLNFLFGYQVPAGQVQALNPIWIFILSPDSLGPTPGSESARAVICRSP
jgi:dipeptide/tripeptide permease